MKKLVIFINILICFFLLGCDAIDDTFKDEPTTTYKTGVLSVQVLTDKESGTHFLDGSGEIIALRSLSIDLSKNQYLNNKVQVTGLMNEEDDVFEVTGVSVVEVLDKDPDAPKFVPFKSSDFGIQMKYYDDWEVSEAGDTITFSQGLSADSTYQPDVISITQYPFNYEPSMDEEGNTDTPLEAYMKENYSYIEDPSSNLHKIGANNLNAIQLESENASIYYLIYRNGLIYDIAFFPGQVSKDENLAIFNEMLAEFKFIGFTVEEELLDDVGEGEEVVEESSSDSTVIPVLEFNMQAFESLPYHFSAQYPSDWYYAGSFSSEAGVLHHYAFSDEPVAEDNEILSLDVINSNVPEGEALVYGGKNFIVEDYDGLYTLYVSDSDNNYRVSGPSEYEGFIFSIANSISSIEVPE